MSTTHLDSLRAVAKQLAARGPAPDPAICHVTTDYEWHDGPLNSGVGFYRCGKARPCPEHEAGE